MPLSPTDWIFEVLCVTDLGYSDGVDPQQQSVFIVTAQEFDVGRLLLDAGMLRERVQAEEAETLKWLSHDSAVHCH